MEAGEDIIPFTSLAVKETCSWKAIPPRTRQRIFRLRHAVEHARHCLYSFCYDGYVETDDGTHDALIAEGGVPSADKGFAVGQTRSTTKAPSRSSPSRSTSGPLRTS